MQAKFLIIGILVLVVGAGAWWFFTAGPQLGQGGVEGFVKDFGKNIQNVNLQGEPDELARSLQKNYGDFVDPALLEQWAGGFLSAPGRHGASPRPDRIEISSVEEVSPGTYQVVGKIIEVVNEGSSADGDTAITQSIAVMVEDKEGTLSITDVILGTREPFNE